MAFDEDAVVEVMRRLQPVLDGIAAALQALDERPVSSSEPIHPVKVTNTYADGSGGFYTKTWVEE